MKTCRIARTLVEVNTQNSSYFSNLKGSYSIQIGGYDKIGLNNLSIILKSDDTTSCLSQKQLRF